MNQKFAAVLIEERCEACASLVDANSLREVVLPSGRRARICSQHDDNQVWEQGDELNFLWNNM
jgi:hypothetical protein